MRTTIDIDDDVLAAAKELAKAEGKTMGDVISDLARRALTTPVLSGAGSAPSGPLRGLAEPQARFDTGAWPTFPRRDGAPVTNELVRQIQDQLDLEDATPFDHTTGQPRVFDDA